MEELKQRPKGEKIELGKGMIDNHACTKYRITFDADRLMDVWRTWESPSATVWIARDVSPCPLRLAVVGSDGRTNYTFRINNVESAKIDKKMFEPPKGFTKCETADALMKIIMEHWPKEKAK